MTDRMIEWMDSVSTNEWRWYVKYLSGNDTLLTGSHQAGPYLPKGVVFDLFPSLNSAELENPRVRFHALIDSHGVESQPTAIWYNNKLRGGTRNECRITGWGGSSSPLLDPNSTGSLCILAFRQRGEGDSDLCRVWLCENSDEEDVVLERVGPVEPGIGVTYESGEHGATAHLRRRSETPCRLSADEIPPDWLIQFPDTRAILDLAVHRAKVPLTANADERLLRRRDCEYDVFRSVEEATVLPRIREGFSSVDDFVDYANSVTNRRKSRSGSSLELHVARILDEEGVSYAMNEKTEGNKRPDFLFPSAWAYRDSATPEHELQMLAVKSTCKDRWRQILNEADRIPHKHLLTLQQGISEQQFAEMQAACVTLVVPGRLHRFYSARTRPLLLTFEGFIRRLPRDRR